MSNELNPPAIYFRKPPGSNRARRTAVSQLSPTKLNALGIHVQLVEQPNPTLERLRKKLAQKQEGFKSTNT